MADQYDRACNDHGDHGVCTHCGQLHTVTILRPCVRCLGPADRPGSDYCAEYPRCEPDWTFQRLRLVGGRRG